MSYLIALIDPDGEITLADRDGAEVLIEEHGYQRAPEDADTAPEVAKSADPNPPHGRDDGTGDRDEADIDQVTDEDGTVDLAKLSRGALNRLAVEKYGITDANTLPNRDAVIEAIEAKQA